MSRLRAALWGGVALLFAVLIAVVWHQNEAKDLFPVWRAVSTFLHGGRPYAVDLFVYPPSALLIFAPLGAVGFDAARAVFLAVDALATAAAAMMVLRLLGVSLRSLLAPLIAGAIVVYAPVGSTLHLGNVNGLVLAGECAALLCASTGRWRLAGALLGVTFAVKPVLLPLLLIPLLWRRWRAAAIAVAVPAVLSGIVLLLSAAPTQFFHRTVPLLVRGNEHGLQIFNVSISGIGQSIGAPGVLAGAVRLAALAAVTYLGTLRWRRPDGGVEKLVDITALILIATFLCFSFSWNYYAIYLLPALVLAALGRSAMPRWALVSGLVLTGSPDVWLWRHGADTSARLAAARVTLGLLVLLAGYASTLAPLRRRISSVSPAASR